MNEFDVKPGTNPPDSLYGLPLFPEPPALAASNLDTSEQKLTDTIHQQLATFSPQDATQKLKQEPDNVWVKRGQERALALFHAAAAYVPAYRDVLQKHQVDPRQINTFQDFTRQVPVIDKESYIQQYPLNQRYWHGRLPNADMVVASSGTYGKQPTMWPRTQLLEAQAYLDHELALAEIFELASKSTLAVVCFAMGMHIAGTITMQSMLHLSRRGYPLSVVTPGNILENILSTIKELSPHYDQVMLLGYPPYMKEVVDRGYADGIDWKQMQVRFMFAAEGFNETWRSYLAELTDSDPLASFVSVYGSADAAAMAQETTTSITLRRKILAHKQLRARLFNSQRLPALFQYYPEHKYFEDIDGELVVTASAGVPLIRYNMHDQGGVIHHDAMNEISELRPELEELKSHNHLWNLPFVYVYGRSNQMAVLYGANIYLEHVRHAIESSDLRDQLSGKIIMKTKDDENKDQRLYIEIECSKGEEPSDKLLERVAHNINASLIELNGEYRDAVDKVGEKAVPVIQLLHYGAERFHQKQMKHKWSESKKQ